LDWFFALVGLHTAGQMSINPLQPSEVEAWFRLMRIEPDPWEVDAVFAMDAAFLERLADKSKSRKGSIQAAATVSADNVEGVNAIMRSLSSRKPNGSLISRHGQ
jgi:hypothetical protein